MVKVFNEGWKGSFFFAATFYRYANTSSISLAPSQCPALRELAQIEVPAKDKRRALTRLLGVLADLTVPGFPVLPRPVLPLVVELLRLDTARLKDNWPSGVVLPQSFLRARSPVRSLSSCDTFCIRWLSLEQRFRMIVFERPSSPPPPAVSLFRDFPRSSRSRFSPDPQKLKKTTNPTPKVTPKPPPPRALSCALEE